MCPDIRASPVIPLLSPEDLKRSWGTPLEDTSADASLRRFAVKWKLEQDRWLGQETFSQGRVVYRDDPSPEMYGRLPDVVLLIQEALAWLLHHQKSLDDPVKRAQEEEDVLELSQRANEICQKHPEKLVVWTRILAFLIEPGGLYCGPSVNWTLTRKEFVIVFARIGGSPTQRVSVRIGWGGEQSRTPLPKQIRRRLAPDAQKRFYFPELMQTRQVLDTALKDARALVCLYLVQKQLVSIDDDPIVRDFLLSYLKGFKGTNQVGVHRVLEYLRRHYQIPEDYRAFRKYIASVIKGLKKEDEDQYQTGEEASVRKVAVQTGISERTIYHLVGEGKVRAVQRDGQTRLTPEGLEDLRKWRANRQRIEVDKERAQLLVEYKGISFESAMRKFRRWRRNDLEEKDIAKKIARACGLVSETAGEE